MPDERAREIVALRDRCKGKQANFRNLWQSISDIMFQHTYGISTTHSVGSELMAEVFDTTAMEESENMTSGLVVNLFPPGQRFFEITPDLYQPSEQAVHYTSALTRKLHTLIADSNFIAQISNTIQYWLTFGTGALYSEWSGGSLNYRDYSIGTYQCLENAKGVVDTVILSCPMTARQAIQKFGGKAGPSITKANEKPETRDDLFDIIHCIQPRSDFDPNPVMRLTEKMPFASVFVNEKDLVVIQEGGFEEFPFAVPRYQVIYQEVYGRGRGTTMLPQVRVLNRLAKDYQEMSNKWVNPPREVLESFDGEVDVTPGATNYVVTMGSIAAIDMGANGAYPITKDILEYHREGIRQGFFKNAFEALAGLSGDRRTTTEIVERLKEGMKKLSKPLGRLFIELLTPVITRSALLTLRSGKVPPPPPELQGKPFKIKIINPLALALADQESRGLQYWVSAGQQMEQTFPGVVDNVNSDKAYRDLGRSLGVNAEHIREEDDVEFIREERARRMAEQQALQAAQVAGEAYGKTTKSPEEGSPAGMLMGA